MNTALTSLLTFLLFMNFAYGHADGHGEILSGVGPEGGKLASVVSAKDAEKRNLATTKALAEWWQLGHVVKIKIWNKKQKRAISFAGAEVKWILLGQKLSKPEIIVAKVASDGILRQEFAAISEADSIELILPRLGAKKEKHLVFISLQPPAAAG